MKTVCSILQKETSHLKARKKKEKQFRKGMYLENLQSQKTFQ